MEHRFKPFIILKKLQRAWAFFFFFFLPCSKLASSVNNPHYFIARVMRRLHSVGLSKGQLLHNGSGLRAVC